VGQVAEVEVRGGAVQIEEAHEVQAAADVHIAAELDSSEEE
jgi:hypothetical protein